MCNKLFSLNYGMDNQNPLTFLSNVQRKVVKQLKNSNLHSIYHIATVTVNLFEILKILPRMYLPCAIKCFPSILIWAIQSIIIFVQCSMEAFQTI